MPGSTTLALEASQTALFVIWLDPPLCIRTKYLQQGLKSAVYPNSGVVKTTTTIRTGTTFSSLPVVICVVYEYLVILVRLDLLLPPQLCPSSKPASAVLRDLFSPGGSGLLSCGRIRLPLPYHFVMDASPDQRPVTACSTLTSGTEICEIEQSETADRLNLSTKGVQTALGTSFALENRDSKSKLVLQIHVLALHPACIPSCLRSIALKL